MLFPTTVAALYWTRATKWGCIASILGGELTYVAYYFKWLSPDLTFGFLSVVPVVIVATVLLVVVSLATSRADAGAEETVEPAA